MPKTIGVEEEFLLVNDSCEQGHIEAEMLEEILAEGSGVSPEIFDSHLEVQTAPCSDFDTLEDEILRGRFRAQNMARRYDLNICASGTVGCYNWQDVKPLPFPRVVGIVEDFSETFRSQSIAALHLHTKMGSLEKSLQMVNAMSWYTWLFLALSGSSRFYDRRDTGLSSRRLSLIGQTPRTGLPAYYASPKDYEYEQEALKIGGWEKNKLWYYLRHNPNHDTVELRIMDSIPRVDDVSLMSAFDATLVARLSIPIFIAQGFILGRKRETSVNIMAIILAVVLIGIIYASVKSEDSSPHFCRYYYI